MAFNPFSKTAQQSVMKDDPFFEPRTPPSSFEKGTAYQPTWNQNPSGTHFSNGSSNAGCVIFVIFFCGLFFFLFCILTSLAFWVLDSPDLEFQPPKIEFNFGPSAKHSEFQTSPFINDSFGPWQRRTHEIQNDDESDPEGWQGIRRQLNSEIIQRYQNTKELDQVFGQITEYRSDITIKKSRRILNKSGGFRIEIKGQGISGLLKIAMKRGRIKSVESTINDVTIALKSDSPEEFHKRVYNLLNQLSKSKEN